MAANQIGLKRRIVVLKRLGGQYVTMLNPKICSSSIPFLSIEICASLPGRIRLKKRKVFLVVEYVDLSEKKNVLRLSWFASFTMQQELDHLDGKLIID
ncbi:MAG: peptide deformylase [Nanoarchaeota archaeon]